MAWLICSHIFFPRENWIICIRRKMQIFGHSDWLTQRLLRKWFEPRSSIPWLKKIIWVIGVLRRTVVSDWRFDNLCGSHLQSQVVVLVSWKFKNPGEEDYYHNKELSILSPWQIYRNYQAKSWLQKLKEKVKKSRLPNLEYNMKSQDMHRDRFATGDWTDDSDQMILILLSLVENDGKVINFMIMMMMTTIKMVMSGGE